MMKPVVSLVPILLIIIFLISISQYCSADDPLGNYCDNNTNLTSQTSSNINHLLSTVVNLVSPNGFISTSYGRYTDQIHLLAQCREDVGKQNCSSCIREASVQIKTACPTQSDARIWYDYCFLRYSKVDFAGEVDTGIGILYANVENVTHPASFKKKLGSLFDQVVLKAIDPYSGGLGKGQQKVGDDGTLYGLVQCTGDISGLQCAKCLGDAFQNFNGFCSDKKGCRVLYSSCYVRYELYPFFFPMKKQGDDRLVKAVKHP